MFDMKCLDALGYDAGSTDPLYKHVPFLMTRTTNGAFGIFYDNLSASRFNLGAEVDNYHRPFTSWQADHGDIDFWVMTAERVTSLTRRSCVLPATRLFYRAGPWGTRAQRCTTPMPLTPPTSY
nr:hypothetical protein [Cutibacterium modestum]